MGRMLRSSLLILGLRAVQSQQVGTEQAENHPQLTTYTCAAGGTCTPDTTTSLVLDANWRWTHKVGDATNCYTGDEWDTGICPDPVTCAANCALDGADYAGTYGVRVSGDSASFKLVTVGQYDTNIGARTYVMDSPTTYKQYKVKNREFVFDADVSQMPCGLNGALYFVDMDADGGMSRFPGNKAGAAYGTGYCDAQCPHDDKFINGEANILGWAPDPNGDPNSGDGKFGTCCTEMDVWEANSMAEAYTPHMCTVDGQYRCNGTECGDTSAGQRFNGVCDKNGCDLNPYRAGDTGFFGPGGGAPANGCNLAVGMNNMGTIMGSPTIETDPTACCILCNSTAGCAGFTFVAASSNCFLKSVVGTPVADPGATSGTHAGPPPAGGASVDTSKPFTVVTQFKTSDGTDAGDLVEIVRFFVQDGVHIPHPSAPSIPPGNYSSITDAFCKAKGTAWGDNDNFETFGGLQRMGQVLDRGVTLVLSQWLDFEAHMLWLDALAYPVDAPPGPGVARGPCATTTGVPSDVIAQHPDATVVYSKITVAPIGTTHARLARGEARV